MVGELTCFRFGSDPIEIYQDLMGYDWVGVTYS